MQGEVWGGEEGERGGNEGLKGGREGLRGGRKELSWGGMGYGYLGQELLNVSISIYLKIT